MKAAVLVRGHLFLVQMRESMALDVTPYLLARATFDDGNARSMFRWSRWTDTAPLSIGIIDEVEGDDGERNVLIGD